MGTHPIFESDFDCLTDMNRLISRTLSTTKSRLALIEKDAIIHVSWATPSKKLGVAHSKYGDVTVKEVNIAKPPDEKVSADMFDFVDSLGNGEKIKCDIETIQGRLTATNVLKADGSFILMPHKQAYNYMSPMMPHGNRPKNSPTVATQKFKRYMKNPRRFPDDSEQQAAIGKTRFFHQDKLDAANKRRNRKPID